MNENERMERLGIFGGTFDPPHNGHVMAAAEVRAACGLDRVLFVPAGDPWQKGAAVVASAADRLAMARAAVHEVDGVEVDAIEVERSGPSYTIDTVEALSAPDRALYLVVGADAAVRLDTWHRSEALRALVTLVIVNREGAASTVPPGEGWRVERVEIPRLDISSTALRARIAAGRPIDGLVPPAVRREISARHLYHQVQ